jgi:KDO2-lipid IV(A) lauroyltransferase
MTVQSWPIEVGLWIAGACGDVMYVLDRKHRERSIANLRRSLPHLSEARMKQITRKSFRNELFNLGIEFFFTTRKIRFSSFKRVIEFDNFQETLDVMTRNERGVILLTAHYGNWEVLGYAMATLGFETLSVARPLDNPYVYDFVIGVRERMGQKIIAKKGMTDEVQAELEKQGMVGFIADQDAGKKGLFVDFFGRKASTYKSIGLLAMHYETPIVVGYARRIEGQYKFRIGSQDVIYPADWKSQPDPLHYITQRYTKAVEDIVRHDPEQYLWMHRRWKSRPKGEVAGKFD